eukprot:1143098-Pelagomonas_calceolata.AAC.1
MFDTRAHTQSAPLPQLQQRCIHLACQALSTACVQQARKPPKALAAAQGRKRIGSPVGPAAYR